MVVDVSLLCLYSLAQRAPAHKTHNIALVVALIVLLAGAGLVMLIVALRKRGVLDRVVEDLLSRHRFDDYPGVQPPPAVDERLEHYFDGITRTAYHAGVERFLHRSLSGLDVYVAFSRAATRWSIIDKYKRARPRGDNSNMPPLISIVVIGVGPGLPRFMLRSKAVLSLEGVSPDKNAIPRNHPLAARLFLTTRRSERDMTRYLLLHGEPARLLGERFVHPITAGGDSLALHIDPTLHSVRDLDRWVDAAVALAGAVRDRMAELAGPAEGEPAYDTEGDHATTPKDLSP